MHLGMVETHVSFLGNCDVSFTFTSDLAFKIIVSAAYLLYYLVCGGSEPWDDRVLRSTIGSL